MSSRAYEERARVWYFKQERDTQTKLSKDYSDWRRNKKFYEQKTFWTWLYLTNKNAIDTFTEQQRHKIIPNPVTERQAEEQARKEETERQTPTAYPDDTSTQVTEDEYKAETTEKNPQDKTAGKETIEPEDETEKEIKNAGFWTDKKNIFAVAVAIGVLTLGILL